MLPDTLTYRTFDELYKDWFKYARKCVYCRKLSEHDRQAIADDALMRVWRYMDRREYAASYVSRMVLYSTRETLRAHNAIKRNKYLGLPTFSGTLKPDSYSVDYERRIDARRLAVANPANICRLALGLTTQQNRHQIATRLLKKLDP